MRVFKNIRQTPRVFGLELSLFLVLFAVILITTLTVFSFLSFFAVYVGLIVIGGTVVVVSKVSHLNLDTFVEFPKTIITRYGRSIH